MAFLSNCIKGIVIGAGAILPGISSGVLCVIFGIYEKLLDSILNFFKDIKKNIKFLFPIAVGILIGVLIFSNILNYFLTYFPVQIKSVKISFLRRSSTFHAFLNVCNTYFTSAFPPAASIFSLADAVKALS